LIKDTTHNDNGSPLYHRRAPENQGRTGSVKHRCPNSPILSIKFYVHVNVEAYRSVHAIKYICKNTDAADPVKEVQTY
ncbi:unnamed protein product, partial [Ceratitis capitata]